MFELLMKLVVLGMLHHSDTVGPPNWNKLSAKTKHKPQIVLFSTAKCFSVAFIQEYILTINVHRRIFVILQTELDLQIEKAPESASIFTPDLERAFTQCNG